MIHFVRHAGLLYVLIENVMGAVAKLNKGKESFIDIAVELMYVDSIHWGPLQLPKSHGEGSWRLHLIGAVDQMTFLHAAISGMLAYDPFASASSLWQ